MLKTATGVSLKGLACNDIAFGGVAIDSRSVRPGDLFVALAGQRTDGHLFVSEALGRGAAAALVREDYEAPTPGLRRHLIRVNDPLRALQQVAAARRRSFKGPVVGVTGSSGKTTTKEMIAAVLDGSFSVLRTRGNLNNHIGVPLTLLELAPEHTAAVIEMGMNAPGEIAFLSSMVRPTVGVITNIGAAHLEGVGGVEDVLRAKLEMLDALDGPLIVPGDDPRVAGALSGRGIESVGFGFENGAPVRATGMDADETGSRFTVRDTTFRLCIPGRFNVLNALAAVAVGEHLGVTRAEAAERLAHFTGVPARFRILRHDELLIIDDTYNANPVSLEAALAELSALEGRRVAVLGDMLELGPRAAEFHRKAGQWARRYGVDLFIGVGLLMRHAVEAFGPGGTTVETSEAAAAEIGAIIRPGDCILVKGSRATRMERVVEAIRHAL